MRMSNGTTFNFLAVFVTWDFHIFGYYLWPWTFFDIFLWQWTFDFLRFFVTADFWDFGIFCDHGAHTVSVVKEDATVSHVHVSVATAAVHLKSRNVLLPITFFPCFYFCRSHFIHKYTKFCTVQKFLPLWYYRIFGNFTYKFFVKNLFHVKNFLLL